MNYKERQSTAGSPHESLTWGSPISTENDRVPKLGALQPIHALRNDAEQTSLTLLEVADVNSPAEVVERVSNSEEINRPNAEGEDPTKASAICNHLCANCKGLGLLEEGKCYCNLKTTDETLESCLLKAEAHAKFLDLDWKVTYDSEPPNDVRLPNMGTTLSNETKDENAHTRRLARSPQFYGQSPTNFYGKQSNPFFNTQRAYRSSDGVGNVHTYELLLGDSDEDRIELVFPDSDGLEIEHQYLFQDEDGDEHLCPDVTSNESTSETSYLPPNIGEQPLNQWNGVGDVRKQSEPNNWGRNSNSNGWGYPNTYSP